MTLVLRARAVLASPDDWRDGGGVEISGSRITRVFASHRAATRAGARRTLDLDGVLTAGFVNAHAHLELTALATRTPRGPDFGAWVKRVIELRAAASPAELAEGVRRGLARALATGTTSIADIASSDAFELVDEREGPRVWVHREALDAHDATRTGAAFSRVSRRFPRAARRLAGLAPHAPFTTSPELLARLAQLARRSRWPVTIHWAESRAEIEWLARGRGPLAALLGKSPRQSGLALIERAGLLRAPLALVHGNHPERGDARRIARAGAVLVHCPGSHAWFERAPFPLATYTRRGVELALGTDSLASNEDLDMRREMRLVRAAFPGLAPARVWRMATAAGARGLGMAQRIGELRAGAYADCVEHACSARSRSLALEELTSGVCEVARAWIGGRDARVSVGIDRSRTRAS